LINKNENKSTLKRILRRSWLVGAAYNNVRGQGHGCLYVLYPLIEKLYPNPEDRERKIEAIKRHLVFYNITPQVNTVGLGLFAAMEEKVAKDKKFDPSTVNALKAAIMGPASGIGDAMFQVTIRIIATSIGLSLALNGSPLGGLLFFLIFNSCSYFLRKYLLNLSYNSGEKLVTEASESGIIQLISNAAAIIGLFMVGAMVAQTVNVNLALSWTTAGAKVTLQSFFDAIMPKLIPLGLTLGVMKAIQKKMNGNLIMIGMIAVGILGAWVGLF
jgi:mannose/fructose/N-acetylgalactosamine-specific phosphotransferase system component IID